MQTEREKLWLTNDFIYTDEDINPPFRHLHLMK